MLPLSLSGLRIHRSTDGGYDVKRESIFQPVLNLVDRV